MRTAAKKDANHNQIEALFERLGWSVLPIYQIPKTADLVVMKVKLAAVIEIKDGSKPLSERKLTAGEREFSERWGGWYCVIESDDDVVDFDIGMRTKGQPPERLRRGRCLKL